MKNEHWDQLSRDEQFAQEIGIGCLKQLDLMREVVTLRESVQNAKDEIKTLKAKVHKLDLNTVAETHGWNEVKDENES